MTGGSGGGENGRVLAVRAWEPAVSGRGANSLQLAEVLLLITMELSSLAGTSRDVLRRVDRDGQLPVNLVAWRGL